MNNIRLTLSHREAIKKELLRQKFEPREKAIKDRRQKLGVAVYEEAFTAKERRLMKRLPAGWLPTRETIFGRLGGSDFHETFAKPFLYPHNTGSYGCLIAIGADHPLSIEYTKIREEESAIERERIKLGHEIVAITHSVSTTNKLVTAWPEITRLVNKVCKTDAINANLPVVKVADLNRSLGLVAA